MFIAFLALATTTNAVISQPRSRGTYHVPLSKKRIERRNDITIQGISASEGFWFGEFTVGGSFNLSMMIDTGSADVIVNPGLYTPGAASKNLNQTFVGTYGTTSSNGTGNGTV